ncbi:MULTISPECIES: hypothetical protein [Acinetobacter calcoaceticus/baumannii complex]|uniref:hypothetical protein n=1 Tax=Acinetobacter calcoaceticus/baumannii complex TaxID=909768 RepID=UPI001EF0D063|nr:MULTISPECIES: hypothetical protein [Acinetobacter calcoaceticus/baumannii complex]MCG6640965.1 DUF3168 domain-containing protein [Acinetobacter baumannii]MCJ9204593.1 hypothetical protein [Acinetobacter baumannii]MCJ9329171.1 hypothetical protein [Acinetobacter baumannii]MCJ9526310.1 hypothetical protein [Acinetobacter baumannii]MCJ9530152.1 hypothetical protein [Acinetobacter baumannii]
MLASEIIYQILGPLFNDQVAPAPLSPGMEIHGTYITYQTLNGNPLNTVKTWTGYDQLRVQINIHNADKVQCEKDAARVKRALVDQKLSSCSLIGDSDGGFDDETQLFQQQVDILIWQIAEE